MLTNHKLLIDQDCPMCNIYGQGFKKVGLIANDTLLPYQVAGTDVTRHIDMDLARNAIALHSAKETVYGIDALIKIISQEHRLVKRFLEMPIVYHPLVWVYNVISYNRKLIYPTPAGSNSTCTPDVNLTYRWTYIILVALFTGLTLSTWGGKVMTSFGLNHNPIVEWIMCFGQIGWQAAAITFIAKDKALDYLGNMSTVSLMGGIAIALLLVLNIWIPFTGMGFLFALGVVVSLMLIEHIRRCRLLGVTYMMTVSWVAFRFVFLIIILITVY